MVSSVGTTTASTSLLSQAIAAAKSNAAANAAAASSSTSTSASSSSSSLSSLGGNFNQFLTLLTTQLQHQDPSNPTSTDSFTAELAQFAGVQQQVETNTNLTSLISATQDNQMASAVSLIGKTTTASSSSLPLQSGSASLSFTAPQAEDVAIAVTDSTGTVVKSETVNASAGINTWTWNGKNNSGTQLSDGAYTVAVEGSSTDGTSVALPTTITGTVTSVSKGTTGVNIDMGDATIDMSDLTGFSTT
ncbi:flagellar hook assembly protein FlgD [Gluconobacter sphaericus]|uniref:Basal-body rod modification protein FlgD n=1 Tax=Gluconobacter sphaericus NBRC 12467 TaxID=1307951 RepID=A0AA37W8K9_9PROT|nr:flagellar hook capping FlgD N-terminal domain-containing protein [Gluconobacter sphaericus]MBF0885775.1 flagellar biosynthesis protein FlgD [Gluconobacter sphaericus]GBR55024.1 basal-body rod modification protein FlgD [Gluconobacter sphaericus NBRC 12467]GEB42863.1 flagellar hook assembly protein [Gluconobacter sphaericus NBRC 12467]GLQ83242.1 flagellar hook assembly protein [Gluconobacter sphaericus NBRC 12467]